MPDESLFRGYNLSETDETGELEINSIRFPDFSCNWSRFSEPADVRKRLNGKPTDGCISFLVEHVRYKKMATTCHDPLENNYSHTEVRQLLPEEDVFTEPPNNRKLQKAKEGWSKSQRMEYRQHLVFNKNIEIQAEA